MRNHRLPTAAKRYLSGTGFDAESNRLLCAFVHRGKNGRETIGNGDATAE